MRVENRDAVVHGIECRLQLPRRDVGMRAFDLGQRVGGGELRLRFPFHQSAAAGIVQREKYHQTGQSGQPRDRRREHAGLIGPCADGAQDFLLIQTDSDGQFVSRHAPERM